MAIGSGTMFSTWTFEIAEELRPEEWSQKLLQMMSQRPDLQMQTGSYGLHTTQTYRRFTERCEKS